jgi:ABC-type lipoprotein export system ATPase subunit
LSDFHKKEGKIINIVIHDIEIVRLATQVVHLLDGRIESIEVCTEEHACG